MRCGRCGRFMRDDGTTDPSGEYDEYWVCGTAACKKAEADAYTAWHDSVAWEAMARSFDEDAARANAMLAEIRVELGREPTYAESYSRIQAAINSPPTAVTTPDLGTTEPKAKD